MIKPNASPATNSRILIIDSDVSTRVSLAKVLQSEGYQVSHISGGRGAIEFLDHNPIPDLVMLDVTMPDVDGFAVCAHLRKLDRSVPVVMLIGVDMVNEIDAAFSGGATDFIMKPINWSLLIPRIRNVLRTYSMTLTLDRERILQSEAQEIARLGFFEWDSQAGMMDWSPGSMELFGLPETIKEQGLDGYLLRVSDSQGDQVERGLREVANGIREKVILEYGLSCEEGERRIRAIARRSSSNRVLCVIQDITDFYNASQTIEFQRHHDTLTRMSNRVHFYRKVDEELESGNLCAVLTMDIDRFHMINDSYGQAAGDRLLQLLSLRLHAVTHGFYELARLGADEFAILIPEIDSQAMLMSWVEGLQERVCEPYELDGQLVFMESSIGVALSQEHGVDSHHLISAAIQARLVAKQLGGSRVKIFDESCRQNFARRLYIESELRYALERRQFKLYYQPQVDLRSNRVVGVEALIRWDHPEMGLVSPVDFIPIAEQMELIHGIGYWVAEEAIFQASEWFGQGLDIRMGINLSARQFSDDHLAEKLGRMLKTSGLPAHRLDVEITESVAMESPEKVLQILGELRAQGVSVAIDDFGTGYSSLEYLQKFAVEYIKIDRAFVSKLLTSKADMGIVKAVLGIAESLDMRVIAEGAETVEELELLRSLGCDEVQGYYISRPRPAGEVIEVIKRYNSVS